MIWRWIERLCRKIWKDPVALTALILSIFAALAQAIAWWNGPSIRLIRPEHVALYTDVRPDRKAVFIRIAADMSYANVAQQPYGDLVVLERATLSVGKLESRQRWNSFGTINSDAISQTAMTAPQPLPGQSAVSHFTLFTPVPLECPEDDGRCDPMKEYLTVEDFIRELGSASDLKFTFEIELIDESSRVTTCIVPVTNLTRDKLNEVAQGSAPFFYATCHSEEKDAR
jgi:hypothetical protein